MTDPWPVLDEAQRLAWLRLIRTPRVGPATFRDLINHFGSAQAALDGLPDMAARRGKPLKPCDVETVEAEYEAAQRLGAQFVAVGEPGYPSLLAMTDRPPPLLCALTQKKEIAEQASVALVGSRNASAGGLSLAKSMARHLGQNGLVIVSGLARGMDAAAHLGALDSGTIAFTAGGLGRPYPPEHGDLMRAIVDKGGAVYSEMPLDWSARAQDFPRRNRLVAASSYALIVVEAAKKSGSLITASQANELGRLVMAVPGFPLDPRSEGPNALLRDGAILVRDGDDVLEELRPLLARGGSLAHMDERRNRGDQQPYLLEEPGDTGFDRRDDEDGLDGDLGASAAADVEHILTSAMSHTPIDADTLIATTGQSTAAVRVWLLEHELTGDVVRYPGDRFAWNPQHGN